MLSRCFLDFSVCLGAFVTRLSQIASFSPRIMQDAVHPLTKDNLSAKQRDNSDIENDILMIFIFSEMASKSDSIAFPSFPMATV